MNIMKKYLVLFLAFTVLLTVCSCNNKDHSKTDVPPGDNQQTEEPIETGEPSETGEPPKNNHELKISPDDKSIVE